LYYFDFGPEFVLREVILGARCPLESRNLAQEIKNPPEPVEIFKSRPAFDSFQIVRQEQPSTITVNPAQGTNA
jgi:hypothetical protein